MNDILVTGSIAYDTIMVFPDRFRNHLLADQLHILNVCFLTPQNHGKKLTIVGMVVDDQDFTHEWLRQGQVLVEMSSVEQAASLAEARAANEAAQQELRRYQEKIDIPKLLKLWAG